MWSVKEIFILWFQNLQNKTEGVVMKRKGFNKTEKVLEHLQKYGHITSIEAIEKYGATRLSSIIYNLRARGFDIDTIKIPFVDRFGTSSICGNYVLKNKSNC